MALSLPSFLPFSLAPHNLIFLEKAEGIKEGGNKVVIIAYSLR